MFWQLNLIAAIVLLSTIQVNSELVQLTSKTNEELRTEDGKQGTKQFFTNNNENALMPWYDAMEYCQQNGMEPARIDSAAENRYVAQYLNDNFATSRVFWLGATDWGQDGQFYWIRTGQNVQYSNFASGYPNGGPGESCIYVWGDGWWYDQYCFVQDVRPLCQRFV